MSNSVVVSEERIARWAYLGLFAATMAPMLFASCQKAPVASSWAGSVTDSAGVEMVANPAVGVWSDDDGWTVEEVLAFGGLYAQGPSAFGDVTAVDVDAEGNVYVADDLAEMVQVFDSTGAWLLSIGKPGDGPGELRRVLDGLFVVGEEVLIPNHSNQRISRFTLRGVFLGNDPVDLNQGYPLRWDGWRGARPVAQRRPVVDTRVRTSPGDIVVTVGDGDSPDDTLAVLGTDLSVEIVGGLPEIHQFAPEPVWDSSPDGRLVTALTDAWRFEVYDADGLVRVITRPFEQTAVTEAIEQVAREMWREVYTAQRVPPQFIARILGALEFSETLPVLASVGWGPAGSLWVQEMLSEERLAAGGVASDLTEMGSERWGVFDADGRYLGVVTFPERFQPVRVIGERFYGVSRDELDVQSVKAYRVVMH